MSSGMSAPNQRLERTGAQPAHHGRAAVGAGRSTAGPAPTLSLRPGFGALGGSTDPAGQPQPSSPRLAPCPNATPARRHLT